MKLNYNLHATRYSPDAIEDGLNLSISWGNKDEYRKKYDALASRFIENFKLFQNGSSEEVKKAGLKRLS